MSHTILCRDRERGAPRRAGCACPHDYCWHSWKNATQIPSDNRASYVCTLTMVSGGAESRAMRSGAPVRG